MDLKEAFQNIYKDAKKMYNIQQAPKLTLRKDKENAQDIFGKTAHYSPDDLEMGDATSPTYAQDDKHMRKMEMEAYLKGNLLLRDFEDNFKYE